MPKPTATDLSVTSWSMLISPSTRLSIDTREPVTPARATDVKCALQICIMSVTLCHDFMSSLLQSPTLILC